MKKGCLTLMLILLCQSLIFAANFEAGSYDFNKMDLVISGEVVFAFDFGPDNAPLAKGYTKVTEKALFSQENGFGWLRTRGLFSNELITLSGDQKKDYVGGSEEGIFRVLLDRGTYRLTFLFIDLSSHVGINLTINFETFLEEWFLPALRTKVWVTDFFVPGGVLEVRINSSRDLWIINALVISRIN